MRKPHVAMMLVLLVLGVMAGSLVLMQNEVSAPMANSAVACTDTGSPPLRETVPDENKVSAPVGRDQPKEDTDPPVEAPADEAAIEESEPEPFVIAGRVVDGATSEPVQGASATVIGPDGPRNATTDGEGVFRFAYAPGTPAYQSVRDYERILIRISHEMYTEVGDMYELDQPIRISLDAVAVVNVRIEGATCLPPSAWVQWEDGSTPEQPSGRFDAETGTASIKVSSIPENNLGRAKVRWFGQVLQSDPISLERGVVREVVLHVPYGASIVVSVVGPDARPMTGVEVETAIRGESDVSALTDVQGRAEFHGIGAPSTIGVRLRSAPAGKFCVPRQVVEINIAGDRREVMFDLTQTGVVDCRLKGGDHLLSNLTISSADGGAKYYVRFDDEDTGRRIYGLAPGRYQVVARRSDPRLAYEVELEVLPPPNVTEWDQVFGNLSVRIHAVGAPREAELRLVVLSNSRMPRPEHEPTGAHEWELNDLSTQAIVVMIRGAGYASRAVAIRPGEQRRVDIEVESCGTLKLTRNSPLVMGAYIQGLEPKQPRWSIYPSGSYELPAGRYRLMQQYGITKWDPVEVTVKPGETTECEIGPPAVSMLIIYADDGVKLHAHEVSLSRNGVKVPSQFLNSGVANRYLLTFSATGKLKLRVECEGYETFEEEVDFENAGNASIRVKLAKKE